MEAIGLKGEIISDGSVELRWRTKQQAHAFSLLIVRTGAVPAYTALQLGCATTRYRIEHLSRHQRYLICVLIPARAPDAQQGLVCSPWLSVTPRAGLAPSPADEAPGVERHLARPTRFVVMPQERRVTAYWSLSAGFVDRLLLEVNQVDGRKRDRRQLELEPEVSSISLDAGRGVELENGRAYALALRASFAGRALEAATEQQLRCIPAPQGRERAANRELPQAGLIYPSLSLTPEVRIFEDDEEAEGETSESGQAMRCCHCREPVSWQSYLLRCSGCGAEFIPNGRGDFLAVGSLRFGTCRCCLPKKILIEDPGGALRCAHSGKEHIRVPGEAGFLLIEDLPFGLCQCCRPRRPLERKEGGSIRCSRSDEIHENDGAGRYVLVPSQPVFDAAAIDDLLDAGLAEICSSGVSSSRRSQRPSSRR
jgi:hypothetical protein